MTIEILPTAAHGFRGHVAPQVAWDELSRNPRACLVDVRTRAEWAFVGVADESAARGKIVFVEWQSFPDMSENPLFVRQIEAAEIARTAPIFFLCRSGARSQSAARAATAAGFENCFNVDGGFEGDADTAHHRGKLNGWKIAGCPWVQS